MYRYAKGETAEEIALDVLETGDKITIEYLKCAKNYEVLLIPTTKTIPKSKKDEYVKELDYE